MINYVLAGIIVVYAIFIIFRVIRNYEGAAKEGTSLGCYSCAAHKDGTCKNHKCTTKKDVDNMIRQAKKNLEHKDTEVNND
ncbi:MAG: hypothetical protein K6G00_07795 [Treponema sp.]|nr:hypothetical protein [Treponema sp.]